MDESVLTKKQCVEKLDEALRKLKIKVKESNGCLDHIKIRNSIKALKPSHRHVKRRVPCLEIVETLDIYPPSEEIKICKDLNFSTTSLRNNYNEIIKTFLTDSKINENNIGVVYKMLLEMEDITCMSEFLPLIQKNVIINYTGMNEECWVSLNNCPNIEDIVAPLIDEVVLVPKASQAISAIVPLKHMTDLLLPHHHENTIYDGSIYRRHVATVQQITKDRVYFLLNMDSSFNSTNLFKTRYDIIFRSRRYPIRYQHYALELLANSYDIRKYLFPKESPYKELSIQPKMELNLFNSTISSNPEQLMAVRSIVEGPNVNAPFVVFGPPGTGKTTTIVESILQLRLCHPKSRILVTAGSNSACDTIALRICKYFKSSPEHKMIRIFSRRAFEKGIDRKLLDYANIGNGLQFYPRVEEVHQYGIIIATLCTVGKYVTGDVGRGNFFTHIFIDEAGASTIPEALVGIMGIKTHKDCRLVLSGDHKQLGPILKSERAAQLGLKDSLMERLLSFNCYAVDDNSNYDRTLQARLKRNYRSHPEIVRLYNHLYYNNELIAEANEEHVNKAAKWCKLPNPKFPIIFQATHGVTRKDDNSPSSFNDMEAEVVMWFMRRLLIDGINGQKVNQSDIGIITPYKSQNIHIQNRLNQRGWRGVEIGSVEMFQGREKQIIIVSLVRSFTGIGFVRNPKRLNVLLSRPQSLLILIGNPLTLKHHSDFAYILDECKKHGTFMRRKKTRK